MRGPPNHWGRWRFPSRRGYLEFAGFAFADQYAATGVSREVETQTLGVMAASGGVCACTPFRAPVRATFSVREENI
eukprot:6404594-Prymnesium_polylepis.1